MEIHKVKNKKASWKEIITKMVFVPAVFFFSALIIKNLSDPEALTKFGIQDSFGFFFAFSVFLGSATYNFCMKLFKMKGEYFLNLIKSLGMGFLTLFLFLVLFIFTSIMLEADISGWTFAVGCCFAVVLFAFEILLIFKFDKFIDKAIAQLNSPEVKHISSDLLKDADFIKGLKKEFSK